MGMDAYIYVNEDCIDAYRGRERYCYLHSKNDHVNTMKISYDAEGGYGNIVCGIRIGYKNGTSEKEFIHSYDPEEERYGTNTEFTIANMDDVLTVVVSIEGCMNLFRNIDDIDKHFQELFQKELDLYNDSTNSNV